ncbi:MAG TPA: NADPH-dependent oxidoreductase [Prolixibacteraceae bacterium]|nr:NADPH-dependent oxidoreductase [Prolixibacteraceae bacterium]
MDLLLNHRTVRKYQSKDISADILTEILECGIRASNTGNMQLYSIIVTRDPVKKELLEPFHFNQPMVKNAPVVLTICYDMNRFLKWCSLNGTKTDFSNLLWLLTGTVDASILSQNICIAAENLGLGICYLGTILYNAPEISKVLCLPKGVIPITSITLGYPDQVPEITDRLPLDAVVHLEEYEDYSDDRIQSIYSDKEKLESSKQFVQENGMENLAQVYAEVRYKSVDNLYFSGKLLKMLTDQGFVFE